MNKTEDFMEYYGNKNDYIETETVDIKKCNCEDACTCEYENNCDGNCGDERCRDCNELRNG